MMYKCENCGAEFDNGEVVETFDMDGNKTAVCPICQIDNLFETRECVCGNACEEDEPLCIYCNEEVQGLFNTLTETLTEDYNLSSEDIIVLLGKMIEEI